MVFDYVTIKAESRDLSRERARLADFNDARPFHPVERWYQFNLRGTSQSQSWPPSAPAVTGPVLEYP
ncbi:MAG: hypothetical protein ACRECN_08305 [Methylocella sp.]